MNIATIVLALVLAVAFAASGIVKILTLPPAKADADRFGISHNAYKGIGVLEFLGGAGLAIGALVTDFWWVGTAAAAGIVALTVGALLTHLRVKDPAGKAAGAPLFGVLAAAAGVLIYLNA
ncbi:DoxX family protein [Glycomyces mayteni]|uniref:DoxX family protein n=1 Tax=Glycomyces mayteni TaxID=543887 RepID=A0ABW2D5L8_9ACTN|nr:hypothetical protein GCM10025732_50940 [Glycomyces mayteni]